MLYHIWVHLVGAVTISVEPIGMVSSGISALPALQRGVDPTCCLSFGVFIHNHVHGGGLPVSVI